MAKRGKKYNQSIKGIDKESLYELSDAVKLVKESAYASFDESVEVHFNLGVDPKHSDQNIRGTTTFPHGIGQETRVAVVSQGDAVEAALKAGADEAGGEDLIQKIQGGWLDFDVLIASPDMMAKLGKLGKLLGGRGLMPSPKNGTVTPKVAQAVEEFKAGKLEYKNDKYGIIHMVIGKKSFDDVKLIDNLKSLYNVLLKVKPSKVKGTYFKSIVLATSMGPGIKVDPLKVI